MAKNVVKQPRKPRKPTIVRNRKQIWRDIPVMTKVAFIPSCAVCRNYPARLKGAVYLCEAHYGGA